MVFYPLLYNAPTLGRVECGGPRTNPEISEGASGPRGSGTHVLNSPSAFSFCDAFIPGGMGDDAYPSASNLQAARARVPIWCSIFAGSTPRDLVVRDVGIADVDGDGTSLKPAEWQRLRPVRRGGCRREDYFDRRGYGLAAKHN